MRPHTLQLKQQLTLMGKQIKSKITFGNTTLEDELYAVTPLVETSLLKSVMKQLDIKSSVSIPLGTVLKYELGILVNGQYEYLDFGNYVVYNSETQEDLKTYKITCFDKMLYSMKQNESLGVTYPITIKNYLTALANKIGLQVKDTNFYNQDLTIPEELYLEQEYTYRDILDEIAQATGSFIVINGDDKIEVKYPTQTNDTLDEEFLKDININFGEKYGKINSIVLSRSAESDNVYLRDEESVQEDGLCEIKIVDNQIMNFNNRSDFLQGILSALNGLYFYINDFSSIGILYYEVGDIYNIEIGENNYQCLMLADEINITSGIEELVHTNRPEESETDYQKADKTDMKINKTYLIVDKQNQIIESVVSNVTVQNNKISRVEQTVDSLNSKISDIADITISQETMTGSLTFTDINQSAPIHIEIHPIGENISYLYPFDLLYPADNLYIKLRTLRFTNTTTNEVFDYELPDDLLYYDSNNYDELILDYDSNKVYINKKCKYNTSTGAVELLANEVVNEYSFPSINLTDGDYTVRMLKYDNTPFVCYLFARLMAQNIYTSQFATRTELNSKISQTVDNITLDINQRLYNYATTNDLNTAVVTLNSSIALNANSISAEVSRATNAENTISANLTLKVDKSDNGQIISMINASADVITLNSNRLIINSSNFKLNADGNIIATGGTIGGFTITNSSIFSMKDNNFMFIGDGSDDAGDFLVVRTGTEGNYSYPFFVRKDGTMYATNATIAGNITATSGNIGNCTIANCTVTDSCSVPASTIGGTLSTSNIPNISAGKITSGTMSADRINGGSMTISSMSCLSAYATAVMEVGTGGKFVCDGSQGLNTAVPVLTSLTIDSNGRVTAQTWRRLVFKGGILTAVQTSW